MIVDYERVALRLKERLTEKRSWGTSELFELIGSLEVENEIPEGAEGYDARPPRQKHEASEAPAREDAADGRAPAMASH